VDQGSNQCRLCFLHIIIFFQIWDDYLKWANGDQQFEEKTLKLRLRSALMSESKDAQCFDDQSTTSEGKEDDKSSKAYLQTMTHTLIEISKTVKKWSTEAEKYYKEQTKNAKIQNLQAVAAMKLISDEELHARTKSVLLEE
jgi:hypothetical protein